MTVCVKTHYTGNLGGMEETLGEYIKKRRERLGYSTQTAFAEKAGIARAHLNQIETGKISLPNADLRRKIAAALGVTHAELLVAAGELTRDELDLPEDTRSEAVKALAPVIDLVDWDASPGRLEMARHMLLGFIEMDRIRNGGEGV